MPDIRFGPQSFHPTLTVPVPDDFLAAETAPEECTPYLLVALPPSLYHDPWKQQQHSSHPGPDDIVQDIHYLAAGDAAGVELERPVGWLDGPSRRHTSLEPETTQKVSFVAGQGYVTETVKVLPTGSVKDAWGTVSSPLTQASSSKPATRNREVEALLLRLGKMSPESLASRSKDGYQEASLPLEARYQSPVPEDEQRSSAGVAALASTLLAQQSLSALSHPARGVDSHPEGNYVPARIAGIEAIWACSLPIQNLTRHDYSISQVPTWEQIVRPSSLLPSKTHLHLTAPLISALQPPPRGPLDAGTVVVYRRRAGFSSVSAADDGNKGVAVLLPAGDAGLAHLTSGITHAVVCIAALWFFARLWRHTSPSSNVIAP